jgi:catechol 2,3-dioxygenase-like lactoylglutathione lyase family enzyme
MLPQRISFVTLGVNDLVQMTNFYKEKFGWVPMKEEGGIVFFKMNSFILGLFPAHELAEDIGVGQEGSGFKKMTLAINVASEAVVNDLFEVLAAKGVKVVKAPEKVFWGGYRGYVADIEDNYWEIAYNPFLSLDDAGNVLEHQ